MSRFDLDWRVAMGRKIEIPLKQFLEVYDTAVSLNDVASKLKITRNAVTRYVKKHNLQTLLCLSKSREIREQLMDEVFLRYTGSMTINRLMRMYDLKRITVRRYIDRGIQKMYNSENPPKWPIPLINSQIKIVKALVDFDDDPGYFGEEDRIAGDTGLPLSVIKEYLDYASDVMAEQTEKYFAEKHNTKRKVVRRKKEEPQEKTTPIEQLKQMMCQSNS